MRMRAKNLPQQTRGVMLLMMMLMMMMATIMPMATNMVLDDGKAWAMVCPRRSRWRKGALLTLHRYMLLLHLCLLVFPCAVLLLLPKTMSYNGRTLSLSISFFQAAALW